MLRSVRYYTFVGLTWIHEHAVVRQILAMALLQACTRCQFQICEIFGEVIGSKINYNFPPANNTIILLLSNDYKVGLMMLYGRWREIIYDILTCVKS